MRQKNVEYRRQSMTQHTNKNSTKDHGGSEDFKGAENHELHIVK